MKTLYDKLWEEHHVSQLDSGESLLYIDRHYLHEVTSPQAFEGLSKKNLLMLFHAAVATAVLGTDAEKALRCLPSSKSS